MAIFTIAEDRPMEQDDTASVAIRFKKVPGIPRGQRVALLDQLNIRPGETYCAEFSDKTHRRLAYAALLGIIKARHLKDFKVVSRTVGDVYYVYVQRLAEGE